MNNFWTYTIRSVKRATYLLFLYNLLLINSCQCHKPTKNNEPLYKGNEIIVFLGNPGVGKSTLCNSIFQKAVFRSGPSFGTGATTKHQGHIYNNKLYMDTPGLDDVQTRKKAALEIEKALKYNNNYKLVFVVTLESGRIKPSDLVTIKIVRTAIRKIKVEYGIIINKSTKKSIEQFNKGLGGLEGFKNFVAKSILLDKPSSVVIISNEEDLEDEHNAYLKDSNVNREKLLKFLDNLHANRIEANQVQELYVEDYDEKREHMETEYKKSGS